MVTRLEKYQALPRELSQSLFDPVQEKVLLGALEKRGLTSAKAFQLLVLADDVLLGDVTFAALPEAIVALGEIDPALLPEVQKDLIGYRLLPLKEYLPGVMAEMARLQMKEGDYPAFRLQKKRLTPEEFVRQTLKADNLTLTSVELQNRLEFLLSGYLRAIRPVDQTIATMIRPIKVGGLGIAEDQAKLLIKKIDEHRSTIQLADVDAVAVQNPVEQPVTAAPEAVVAPMPVAVASRLPQPLLGKEGSSLPAPKPRVPVDLPRPVAAPSPMDAKVTEILASTGVVFPTEELMSRAKTLLTVRLRDLRGAPETLALLSGAVEQGGLGLSVEVANKLSEELAKVYLDIHGNKQRLMAEDQQKFIQRKTAEAEAKAKLSQKDSEDLAKRYAALTGKVPTTSPNPSLARGEADGQVSRVSAAVSKQDELDKSSAKVDATVKTVLRQAAPRPEAVMPKLSPESLPPSQDGNRPQMADVKYTQKLVGPLEELGMMTLVDFRRLGSDPEQAIMKIQDKIDLLKQQSYEKMVDGVKAWKSSTVNKLYVAISSDALRSGKSVATVVDEWKAAGKDVLTPLEIKAIVKLNTLLRF